MTISPFAICVLIGVLTICCEEFGGSGLKTGNSSQGERNTLIDAGMIDRSPFSDEEESPRSNRWGIKIEQLYATLSLDRPLALVYVDAGPLRGLVALQNGRVMALVRDPGDEKPHEFLDISKRVNDGGMEEGLLGLALDPAFTKNGHFYVYYSALNPNRTVLSRFTMSTGDSFIGDPNSELVILEIGQPYSNHNGGQVQFGPDGYLYLGVGDGGGSGDTLAHSQNPMILLGTILRLDPGALEGTGSYTIPEGNPFRDGIKGRPEVWAYGFRNPWRFTFDFETGDLWAADVGQDRYEEVNLVFPGGNYGWNLMEGSSCFPRGSICTGENLVLPILEYSREKGCSIIGGYVYRGSEIPWLYGRYVYGDFCSGKIWAVQMAPDGGSEAIELIDTTLRISSFAVDRHGEIQIVSLDGGIYKLSAELLP